MLAELIRGRVVNAAVFGGLKGEGGQVHPVDTRIGGRAVARQGSWCSGLAIDALVVAAADLAGGAIAATTDPDDLERLAAHANHVRIVDPSQLTRARGDHAGKLGTQKKCEDDNIERQPPGRSSRRALSSSRSD